MFYVIALLRGRNQIKKCSLAYSAIKSFKWHELIFLGGKFLIIVIFIPFFIFRNILSSACSASWRTINFAQALDSAQGKWVEILYGGCGGLVC